MIKRLSTVNVGPIPEMTIEFGKRLNILTGDNGLGKSFLLDIVWWALTRGWPAELNQRLTTGKKANPARTGKATITYQFFVKTSEIKYESEYNREMQYWIREQGRPGNPGLVLYAMSDGSFAVWDSHRNYWRTTPTGEPVLERPGAYVLSPAEVWDGLSGENGNTLCNGLIRDWAGWQKEKGLVFDYLKEVLAALALSTEEKLDPGELTRISLDDVRDMPTIKMPYGQEVAVLHASAGIRRIIAIAYFLVWTWEEHKRAAELRGQPVAEQVIFLIDEIEAHLHPSWQRRIIPALLKAIAHLTGSANVQLIAATHSPLIMASVEPEYDSARDAWFDFDLADGNVTLNKRDFQKHGDANSWLTSEAFDLQSSRAVEYERLTEEAGALLDEKESAPDREKIQAMHESLSQALSPTDTFLLRWRAICVKKGLLE
jgi:predicted ATPase